jgi:hypothetical protein
LPIKAHLFFWASLALLAALSLVFLDYWWVFWALFALMVFVYAAWYRTPN